MHHFFFPFSRGNNPRYTCSYFPLSTDPRIFSPWWNLPLCHQSQITPFRCSTDETDLRLCYSTKSVFLGEINLSPAPWLLISVLPILKTVPVGYNLSILWRTCEGTHMGALQQRIHLLAFRVPANSTWNLCRIVPGRWQGAIKCYLHSYGSSSPCNPVDHLPQPSEDQYRLVLQK